MQVAQESFRRAQATYDPNQIMAHLQVMLVNQTKKDYIKWPHACRSAMVLL